MGLRRMREGVDEILNLNRRSKRRMRKEEGKKGRVEQRDRLMSRLNG